MSLPQQETQSPLPAQPQRHARPTALAALAVLLAAWILLLASFDPRADATIAGNDAVPYALALEDEDPARILDPHHPLFHVLSWGVARVLAELAPTLEYPGTWALKAVSAAGGAAALALLFAATARLASIPLAFLLAGLLASTAGFRLYAAVGETYWPALAAQLGLLLHLIEAERARRPAELRVLIGWTVLALLLRQDALLGVPCAAALLLLDPRRGNARARFRDGALFLGASGALTLAGYTATYGVYALQAAAPVGPFDWLTKLAQTGQWGGWGGLAPFLSADARPSALRLSLELGAASFDYGLLGWLRGSDASAAFGPLPAAARAALLVAAWIAILAPVLWRPGRTVLAIALLFLLPRLVFYAWWQPGNTEYHCGHWIAGFAAGALALARWSALRSRALRALPGAALAGALVLSAISNERALLAPLREPVLHRRALQIGLWYADGLRVASLDPLMSYALERFGPIPRIELHPPSLTPAELESWASGAVAELGAGLADGLVLVRDTSLASAFGTPPWSIEHASAFVLAALASPYASGLGAPAFLPEDRPPEEAWALLLRPER